ncbi:MAG: hypothetical protein RSB03_06505, partial [Oscillospiraceae bacterium]
MSEVNDRSAMLEKLNAAYERAVKPDAAKDSFSDFAAENQYEKPVSDAVGGLYRDTEKEDARTVAKVEYDDDDDDDDYDIPRKKKGRVGKVIGIVLGALVLLTLVVATLIAEPWVKVPTDEYVEPNAYTAASPKTMGVGETYGFEDIALGENEIISEVKVNDEDILRAEGTAVTALGEYFGTGVYVTVKEKEVKPLSTHKDVMIFGKDLSEPYNKVRSALRNLI